MAWIFLAESAATPSHSGSGSIPSPTVSTTDTLSPFFCLECKTGHCKVLQSGMMFEHCKLLTLAREQESTSSSQDSPARTSAWQEMAQAWKESAAAWSSRYSGSSTRPNRRLSSWKMSQPLGPVAENEWSKNWPAAGMTVGGTIYPLTTWEHRTDETDGSSLLPTPTASTYGTNKGGAAGRTGKARPSLDAMARHNLWPTPRAADGAKGGPGQKFGAGGLTLPAPVRLDADLSGSLNPTFVEWLMGFPIGWTELNALGTQWYQPKRAKRSAA